MGSGSDRKPPTWPVRVPEIQQQGSTSMPRGRRVFPGGNIFHVLNRGNGRQTLFQTPNDYDAFIRVVQETLLVISMRILAYCLMPNHWHFVLWPALDGQLSSFMQQMTSTHVRRWHKARQSDGQGHVYQERFKAFPVQDDDHFYTVCRYVERNPVRAGFAARAEDWVWGSAWGHLHPDDRRGSAVMQLARAASGRLASSRQSTNDAGRDGCDAKVCHTRTPLWQR